MTVSVRMLFGTPQKEIASLLVDRLENCTSASLVAGFLTVDGLKAIAAPIRANQGKLANLVVGSATLKGFEALDQLLGHGVNPDCLHVHLGHSSSGWPPKFQKYRPMLHSKIYLMEMPEGQTAAIIGSHNLTGFAMEGKNGEAAILLEGPSDAVEFHDIRAHIAEAVRQATPYDPGMKEAYAWWSLSYFEGLRAQASLPNDTYALNTIVLLTTQAAGQPPSRGDVVYFEIPQALEQVRSVGTKVHLYVFPNLRVSPDDALDNLADARQFNCLIEGIELENGGVELLAEWMIENRSTGQLKAVPSPFRPVRREGMQQVRIRLEEALPSIPSYAFETNRPTKWEPVFDGQETNVDPDRANFRSAVFRSSLDSPDDERRWHLVAGLRKASPEQERRPREAALIDAAPESGSFILFSPRRKRRLASHEQAPE